MPRIKQNAEKYATSDFLRELRIRMAYLDLPYTKDLAEAADIPASTVALKLKDPDKLTVSQLRKLIKTLDPNPSVVLTYLGYDAKCAKQIGGGLDDMEKPG